MPVAAVLRAARGHGEPPAVGAERHVGGDVERRKEGGAHDRATADVPQAQRGNGGTAGGEPPAVAAERERPRHVGVRVPEPLEPSRVAQVGEAQMTVRGDRRHRTTVRRERNRGDLPSGIDWKTTGARQRPAAEHVDVAGAVRHDEGTSIAGRRHGETCEWDRHACRAEFRGTPSAQLGGEDLRAA